MVPNIYPSLLACDFGHLQRDIDRVTPFVDGLHIDIMDGHFVPNLSFGLPVVRGITTELPLNVHLMVENPEAYIDGFAALHTDTLYVHVECKAVTAQLIEYIRSQGMRPGVALSPETAIKQATSLLDLVEDVLIMSVSPGFGGQQFIPETVDKIRELKTLYPQSRCNVDGGINDQTAPLVRSAGADMLVSGSYIFRHEQPEQAIALLRGV